MLEVMAMKLSDYEEVVTLWTATKELGFSPQFDTKDVIDTYLTRNPECSSVARMNGRIVGAALCGHDGRRGSIYHVAVLSEHRNQGIATRIIERCIEQLKINDIYNGFLFSSNPVSREFWEKQDWQVLPSITYHYKAF